MIPIFLVTVLGASFCFLTLYWVYRIVWTAYDLKKQRVVNYNVPRTVRFRVLLPVLNEDKRLLTFIEYFQQQLAKSDEVELYIITTEREKREYVGSRTLEIAEHAAGANPYIHHIHYPHTYGVMAHQLNYAIQVIDAAEDDIFAVYNADSRPESETFQWVAERVDSSKMQVFQQYGIYTKNLSFFNQQAMRSTLIANAYWQVRWTLGFEYYRARLAQRRSWWTTQPFNYCIGHGLFFSKRLTHYIHFSEKTTNEDAIFGVEVAMQNIVITPVPYFDYSESPDTVTSIYHQKTIWFQGPFQSALYFLHLRRKYKYSLRLFVVCAKLFAHAVYWVFGPIAMLAELGLSMVLGCIVSPFFLLFFIPPILFLAAPLIFAWHALKELRLNKWRATRLNGAQLSFGALVAYVVHGAAGVRGIILSKKLSSGFKQKTPMAQYGEN